MRAFLYALTILFALNVTSISAQPISQIEGFLEVYDPEDTTSMYLGKDAGRFSNSSNVMRNTFVGSVSGRVNSSGIHNTFLGSQSGYSNLNGSSNVFVGMNSGYFNTSGANNTFLGGGAGVSNIDGAYNIIIGQAAGINHTSGRYNTIIGEDAGRSITSGSKNIIIGSDSGPSSNQSSKLYIDVELNNDPLIYGDFDRNDVGINGKLGIGTNEPVFSLDVQGGVSKISAVNGAGQQIVGILEASTSKRPVLLFSEGGNTFSNGMSIEYNGVGLGGDNYLAVNDTDGSPMTTFKNDGNVGIGTTSPTSNLHVEGTAFVSGFFQTGGNHEVVGQLKVGNLPTNGTTDIRINSSGVLSTSTSDIRLKNSIETVDNGLEKVLQLRGVHFHWNAEPEAGKQLGVIAQEVQKIVPEIVTQSNGFLGVDYSEMSALFIEAIKEQQNMINSLQAELADVKSHLGMLQVHKE